MNDYIFLMHADTTSEATDEAWGSYFKFLREKGRFQGGSSIGPGSTVRKEGVPGVLSQHLSGYIRVQAESLEAAKALVIGNPVYECGGTVEVRELPRD